MAAFNFDLQPAIEAVKNLGKAIAKFFADYFDFLKDVLLYVPQKIFSFIVDGLILIIGSIPAPPGITQALSALGTLAPHIGYLSNLFALPQGITLIFSAYAIRFLIRRIPVIG